MFARRTGNGFNTQMTEQSKVIYPERKNEGKAKYMSVNLAYNLLSSNPHSMLKQSYQQTVYCAEIRVEQKTKQGTTLTTKYCKNRWCTFCNRIRTAVLINGYEKPIAEMKDGQFMSLTKDTVTAPNLKASIQFMYDAWRRIMKSKEARRRKIKGIRKAECTIRPNARYHYHFHVIIEGLDNAEWLKVQWLKEMGNLSNPAAQHISSINEGTVKELFKYFTKLTAKNGELIDYKRMDVIFCALRGKRVYQPFGGIKPVKEEIDDVQIEELKELGELAEGENQEQEEQEPEVTNWIYEPEKTDWLNKYGERFSGFVPDQKERNQHEYRGIPLDDVTMTDEILDVSVWLSKWPELEDIA